MSMGLLFIHYNSVVSRLIVTFHLWLRGKKQYEPPRFMTINTAIEQLLEIEQNRGESGEAQTYFTVFRIE